MSMGDQIRAMRQIRGLTQKELAEKLGISAVGVAQWENGLRCPLMGEMHRLAFPTHLLFFSVFQFLGIEARFPIEQRQRLKCQAFQQVLFALSLESGASP